jgi:hypothetical protein
MAVLPRMIKMVVGVVTTGIVAYPFSAAIYVGSIGMSFSVAEVAVFFDGMRSTHFGGAVLGYVCMTATDLGPACACVGLVLCHG